VAGLTNPPPLPPPHRSYYLGLLAHEPAALRVLIQTAADQSS
jgi:hypothetical protein